MWFQEGDLVRLTMNTFVIRGGLCVITAGSGPVNALTIGRIQEDVGDGFKIDWIAEERDWEIAYSSADEYLEVIEISTKSESTKKPKRKNATKERGALSNTIKCVERM